MAWRRGSRLLCLVLLIPHYGCAWMFGPQGVPADPLFTNRKPIESKAKFGPAEAPPFSEPTPPENPYLAERRSLTARLPLADPQDAADSP